MYFFFFNDTATTEIYTLSLHDALPISAVDYARALAARASLAGRFVGEAFASADLVALPTSPVGTPRIADTETGGDARSEEHTSELQSRQYLVCRLLLEKKKSTPHLSTT